MIIKKNEILFITLTFYTIFNHNCPIDLSFRAKRPKRLSQSSYPSDRSPVLTSIKWRTNSIWEISVRPDWHVSTIWKLSSLLPEPRFHTRVKSMASNTFGWAPKTSWEKICWHTFRRPTDGSLTALSPAYLSSSTARPASLEARQLYALTLCIATDCRQKRPSKGSERRDHSLDRITDSYVSCNSTISWATLWIQMTNAWKNIWMNIGCGSRSEKCICIDSTNWKLSPNP